MADRYRSILLFGPPGVGKGTQGKLLGQIPGLYHLATGEMFRGLDKNSDLGREVASYATKGELVPDELTIRLWQKHVKDLIEQGSYIPGRDLLVLDGIPRSCAQAKALDQHIDVLGIVHLTCPDIDETVGRMKRRALKEGRADDADEGVIRRRFDVYQRETSPVLQHYPKDLITNVDGTGTPIAVLMSVLKVVVPICQRHFGNPLG